MRMHKYNGSELFIGGAQFSCLLRSGSVVDFDTIVGTQEVIDGENVTRRDETVEDAVAKHLKDFEPVEDEPEAPARKQRRGSATDGKQSAPPAGDATEKERE